MAKAWRAASQRASFPPNENEQSFFEAVGLGPRRFDSRRRHYRFLFRRRALLMLAAGDEPLGILTVDVSRAGLAIIAPRQLFPGDVAVVVLAGPDRLALCVDRCRRLGPQCYAAASKFRHEAGEAGARQLLREVRSEIARAEGL